jgi:hypothetical protein
MILPPPGGIRYRVLERLIRQKTPIQPIKTKLIRLGAAMKEPALNAVYLRVNRAPSANYDGGGALFTD